MSVRGEFQRVLSDCLGLLHETDAETAEDWITALKQAERGANDDLSGAARHVLDWIDASSLPVGESDLSEEALARVTEHLAAICRVILGGATR